LFIDYLQLLRGSNKSENRVIEVAEITQGLKALAKELNIPVIALAQLSRAVEQREDKRPMLSDLRESGSIEQDADVVMFLYREEYYLRRQEPKQDDVKYSEWVDKLSKVHNFAEIVVAKHRNGAIGNVSVYYEDRYSTVSNLEKIH
jgi:replicative DNA helicase